MAYRRKSRRSFRRSGGRSRGALGGLGLNLSVPTLAGIAIGFSNLDNKLPKDIVMAAAVAPIRTGKIGSAARGIIFGNLLQGVLGRSGNTTSAAGGFGMQ